MLVRSVLVAGAGSGTYPYKLIRGKPPSMITPGGLVGLWHRTVIVPQSKSESRAFDSPPGEFSSSIFASLLFFFSRRPEQFVCLLDHLADRNEVSLSFCSL